MKVINLLFIILVLSLLINCHIQNGDKISETNLLILNNVFEYDSILNLKEIKGNYVIGMMKQISNDTTIIAVVPLFHFEKIISCKINYLYLGYNVPIFSNFIFIRSENQNVIEKILKKSFPYEYTIDVKNRKIINEMDLCHFDSPIMYLFFYKNKFVKKTIE